MVERSSRFNQHVSSIDRRQMLSSVSAVGLLAMAGCIGGDGDDGTGDTDAGDDSGIPPEDVTITGMDAVFPGDMEFNPYSPEWGGHTSVRITAHDLFGRVMRDGSLHHQFSESIEYDPDDQVIDFELSDDITFWDGSSYTAEDLWVFQELDRLTNPDIHQYTEVELIDDYTVRFHTRDPQNPLIAERTTLDNLGWAEENAEFWRPWLEQYQDASDQDARDAVTEDLAQTSMGLETFRDEMMGTGPYELVDITETELRFELRDDHRWSDQIGIGNWVMRYGSQSAVDEMVIAGDIDYYGQPLSGLYADSGPDYLENIVLFSPMFQMKLITNWARNEALQELGVRRAMAAVINTEDVVTNRENGFPVSVHSGMDDDNAGAYLDDIIDDFIDYKPQESDWDLADEFLADAGYSREDGSIYGPDGDEMEELTFIVEEFENWFIPGQTAYGQLEDYGFPIEFNVIDRGEKLDRIGQSEPDWDLVIESHWAEGSKHPYQFYDWGSMWGYPLVAATFSSDDEDEQDLLQWLDDGLEVSPYNAKPLIPEIPQDVGALDASGGSQDINVYELVQEVTEEPISTERDREIVQTLSWMWNYLIPDIDLNQQESGFWGNTQDFEWADPPEHTHVDLVAAPMTIHEGLVQPR